MSISHGLKFACDNNCPRFKECAICAHTIAVAYDSGKLTDFLEGYKVPLEKMVNVCIPAGSGKKENEKRIWRKRKSHAERDVSTYGDRLIDASAQLSPSAEACGDNTPYEVDFVKDMSATMCYGFKGKVREKPSDTPPPPPYDIFIRHL